MCETSLARIKGRVSAAVLHAMTVMCARRMDAEVALEKANACIEKWEAGYYR